MAHAVAVEEATGAKARVRFSELPTLLHGTDPRYAWPVVAWDRYRLDPHRNPYFETGDAVYLFARRRGRPVGRMTAHLDRPGGDGRFGFWCVDDDAEVAAALVHAARAWLTEQGCSSMTGPTSFTDAEEVGVLVAGFEAPGVTGRPWHPPSQAAQLEALGFEPVAERRTWRLPTTELGPDRSLAADAPGHAGRHADPRLVLDGIAAVPDLSGALRGAGLRDAWSLATRARAGDWSTAVVVRCDDDPALAVPALLKAAGAAGYDEVVAPWSTDPEADPETIHRTYRLEW